MKIIVIEDENYIANNLVNILKSIDPSFEITAVLNSVSESLNFFKTTTKNFDIIFSDINLGDGTCFDIFDSVQLYKPIVFCTAYDSFALEAFNYNSIDYVLKPFNKERITKSIAKIKQLIASDLTNKEKNTSQQLFIVHKGDKILPLKLESIMIFVKEFGVTRIIDKNKNYYVSNKSIHELEEQVGENFFRINRQVIINRNAISHISKTLTRKLEVELFLSIEANTTVSKEKATSFVKWFNTHH